MLLNAGPSLQPIFETLKIFKIYNCVEVSDRENLNAGVCSAPVEVRGLFPSGCQGSNSGPQHSVLLPAEPSCQSFIEIFSSYFKLCFIVHTNAYVSQGLETLYCSYYQFFFWRCHHN